MDEFRDGAGHREQNFYRQGLDSSSLRVLDMS